METQSRDFLARSLPARGRAKAAYVGGDNYKLDFHAPERKTQGVNRAHGMNRTN
jgi:hypothetical protein